MKLIIDESVSNKNLEVFDALAKKTGISVDSRVFLKESHPGIPDSQVIQHLLNDETIFVTTDRPFHNKVILAGLRSYYVESGKITSKALRGIKVDSSKFVSRKDTVLRSSYHQPKIEIRGLILPTGDQKLKRLSTKRRRIRGHFGGLDNLAEIAVTVSYSPLRTGILIGVKIRVSSNVGIKALDASENHVFEKPNSNVRGLVALSHALMLVVQLMLHRVKTKVYFDTLAIALPKKADNDEVGSAHFQFFSELVSSFSSIEFIATPKGTLVDRLRDKLKDLISRPYSNEITQGNFDEALKNYINYSSEQKSEPRSEEGATKTEDDQDRSSE